MSNLFDPYDARSAKSRFILRPILNWLSILAIFILVVFLFDNVILNWIVGIILFVVLYGFMRFRSINLKCPGCGRVISSTTPWFCKACNTTNRNVDQHPFLGKCEHCSVEPKAYRCHHKGCDEMIFLSEDTDDTNFASCLNARPEKPEPQKVEVSEDKFKVAAEKIREKKSEIEMAELEEKLKIITERMDGPKVKRPSEQKKESFDNYLDGVMGVREYARKKRAEAAITYKDDPDGLADALEAIDEYLRRNA